MTSRLPVHRVELQPNHGKERDRAPGPELDQVAKAVTKVVELAMQQVDGGSQPDVNVEDGGNVIPERGVVALLVEERFVRVLRLKGGRGRGWESGCHSTMLRILDVDQNTPQKSNPIWKTARWITCVHTSARRLTGG